MSDSPLVLDVKERLSRLYSTHISDLPFHGWHHVEFVVSKACEFAVEMGADVEVVALAGLVHDVNYLLDARTDASAGFELRERLLRSCGAGDDLIVRIESVVLEAETKSRNADISREAMALSDADTVFKALPITPVVMAPLYMRETGASLRELARKIVDEQVPLRSKGIYFYSQSGRTRYQEWAEANLRLWECILESLEDPEVALLLESDYLRSASQ